MRPIAELGETVALRMISNGSWELTVRAPRIARSSRAGQFVHVRCGTGFRPFLRRPLSIGPSRGDNLTLIFTVRGEGTRLLSSVKPGDTIDMIGPLGNGYRTGKAEESSVLIGGGIGVVPLLLLDDQLSSDRKRTFLLGVQSRSLLSVTPAEIDKRNISLATDDGSLGYHGNVVELFEKYVGKSPSDKHVVFACGPAPMLAALKKVCARFNIPAQVSLEVSMGCGVGACQSCAVPRDGGDGYLLVCRDGPVFDINEVRLIESGVL